MNKEKELVVELQDETLENERTLLLVNDDINTFDYVIDTLMEVCEHTMEQAETCAWITHYKGKCPIKSGTYDILKPYHEALLSRHLYACIK